MESDSIYLLLFLALVHGFMLRLKLMVVKGATGIKYAITVFLHKNSTQEGLRLLSQQNKLLHE